MSLKQIYEEAIIKEEEIEVENYEVLNNCFWIFLSFLFYETSNDIYEVMEDIFQSYKKNKDYSEVIDLDLINFNKRIKESESFLNLEKEMFKKNKTIVELVSEKNDIIKDLIEENIYKFEKKEELEVARKRILSFIDIDKITEKKESDVSIYSEMKEDEDETMSEYKNNLFNVFENFLNDKEKTKISSLLDFFRKKELNKTLLNMEESVLNNEKNIHENFNELEKNSKNISGNKSDIEVNFKNAKSINNSLKNSSYSNLGFFNIPDTNFREISFDSAYSENTELNFYLVTHIEANVDFENFKQTLLNIKEDSLTTGVKRIFFMGNFFDFSNSSDKQTEEYYIEKTNEFLNNEMSDFSLTITEGFNDKMHVSSEFLNNKINIREENFYIDEGEYRIIFLNTVKNSKRLRTIETSENFSETVSWFKKALEDNKKIFIFSFLPIFNMNDFIYESEFKNEYFENLTCEEKKMKEIKSLLVDHKRKIIALFNSYFDFDFTFHFDTNSFVNFKKNKQNSFSRVDINNDVVGILGFGMNKTYTNYNLISGKYINLEKDLIEYEEYN